MILNVFTLIFAGVLSGLNLIINLLPMYDVSVSASVIAWRDDFITSVSAVNYLFPIYTFITIIGYIILTESVILNLKVITFVVRLFTKRIDKLA